MLDHIAIGPFAKDPARKDAAPFVVALILHRQLDEGAGFGRVFPWCRRLARAQPHDRAPDAQHLAGFHLELADEAVALVEQAEPRDALGHRGRPRDTADFGPNTLRLQRRRHRLAAVRRRPVASGQRRCGHERDPDPARH